MMHRSRKIISRRGRLLPATLLLGMLLATSACDRGEGAIEAPEGMPEPLTPSAAVENGAGDGTQRMIHRLTLAIDSMDPSSNPWLNKQRAELMRQQPIPEDPGQRILHLAQLGSQLLGGGATEEAVEILTELDAEVLARPDLLSAEQLRDVRMYVAAAHLRLGEEQNCANNHSIDSCLLPIQGQGVHQLREGSEAALVILEQLLDSDPQDLEARWLLNIAHMTLGQYPEQVPEDHLLPPELFASDHEIGRFYDVAAVTGVNLQSLSGGSVTEDFDGDGLLDLMVTSWGVEDQMRLYRNRGDGGFEDVTETAGLTGLVGGLNMVQADYDNDGDVDVFVLRGAWMDSQGEFPNSLLRNDGQGKFEDVTEAAGLLSLRPTQTATWGDYDNDGWVDLFVGNESRPLSQSAKVYPSELFHNNGDGSFTEMGAATGLDITGYVKGAVWADFDNDDRLDLYLSLLEQENMLLMNQGPSEDGRWRFQNRAAEAGVQEPIYSFPTWAWDYDNDGWTDLLVLSYGSPDGLFNGCADEVAADLLGMENNAAHPRLYRNLGDGSFEDRTVDAGLDDVLYAMGSNFGDLDNDGWLDFYVGTGDPNFTSLVPNRMYRNAGDGRFQDVTTSGGFGHLQKGHAISFADMDNDGDEDIFANMGGANEGDWYFNALFENPGHDHHWLTLRLAGSQSNRDAIGSRIRLTVEGPSGRREIHRVVGSGGSFGASSLQQEIGLGDAERVVELRIRWPAGGSEQVLTDLPVDRILAIREGEDVAAPVDAPVVDFPDPLEGGMQHMHDG